MELITRYGNAGEFFVGHLDSTQRPHVNSTREFRLLFKLLLLGALAAVHRPTQHKSGCQRNAQRRQQIVTNVPAALFCHPGLYILQLVRLDAQ